MGMLSPLFWVLCLIRLSYLSSFQELLKLSMSIDLLQRQMSSLLRVWIITLVTVTSILTIGLTSCTPLLKEPSASPSLSKDIQAQSLQSPTTITLETQDGWTLMGDLYVPSGSSQGAIVLLHQRGGSAQDWQPLAIALQQSGFTALAIDQRGAGRSTQEPGLSGNNAPWSTSEDIAAAIASLSERQPIGLVGASYGANNALIYAVAHPNLIKGVALLSPGANYNGLDAIAAARSYQGSLAIYHSRNDSVAGQGPEQINSISSAATHRLQILNGSAHGSGLLSPEVDRDVIKFFQATLKNRCAKKSGL
jgi:pimeloyl-ACP methyl ester carboxylesterase